MGKNEVNYQKLIAYSAIFSVKRFWINCSLVYELSRWLYYYIVTEGVEETVKTLPTYTTTQRVRLAQTHLPYVIAGVVFLVVVAVVVAIAAAMLRCNRSAETQKSLKVKRVERQSSINSTRKNPTRRVTRQSDEVLEDALTRSKLLYSFILLLSYHIFAFNFDGSLSVCWFTLGACHLETSMIAATLPSVKETLRLVMRDMCCIGSSVLTSFTQHMSWVTFHQSQVKRKISTTPSERLAYNLQGLTSWI